MKRTKTTATSKQTTVSLADEEQVKEVLAEAVLETLMIWQLLQVHHLTDTPLILVGEMWPGLLNWAKTSMLASDPPLANAADMDVPQCVSSGDEAIALIRKHHAQWLKKQGESSTKEVARKSSKGVRR
ncbi:MAG: hypothetical protein ABI614_17895 [Planctomycetota bacterium]